MRYVARGRLFVFVLAALVAGVLSLYSSIEHWINYRQVAAHVVSVVYRCHREGTTLGDFKRSRSALAERDCSDAELSYPGSKSKRALIKTLLHVSYVSPADNREHQGVIQFIGWFEDVKSMPRSGKWNILAHTTNPNVIEKI